MTSNRDPDALWTLADGTPMFLDRTGTPVSPRRYGELFQDPAYRIVARTEVGDSAVVTAWLGVDQGDNPQVPLIFGTIVCGPDGEFRDETERFSPDEASARVTHRTMVASIG